MSLWKAFRDGITLATRLPALLVVMFLATSLGALVLTAPVYAAMEAWVGHRLIAHDLARDFDGGLLIEPQLRYFSALPTGTVDPADMQAATLSFVMIVTALIAWLTSSLPNILLGGGVLLTCAEGRFAWRRFLWGAWRWLSAFLALTLLFVICSTLVVTLGVAVLLGRGAIRANALTIPTLGLVGSAYIVLTAWFEFARVIAVAEGTRNIFRALGHAAAFIVRQPLRSLGLYLLMAALGLVLIPLYAHGIAPVIPFEWGVAAVAVQQLFIAARLWTRLARWASQMSLYRSCSGPFAAK